MDMDAGSTARSRRVTGLAAVIASMAAIATFYGFSGQFLSFVLEDRGVGGALIGLSGAMQMAGIFVIMPVLPGLMRRLGPARLMMIGAVLALASIALMALFIDVWIWFPLRLALGAAQSMMWTTGETWLNHESDDRNRGRTISVFMFAVAVGFAAGPFILAEVGSQGATPFVTTAIMIGFIILPLVVARGIRIAPGERPSASLHQYVRLAPVPMVANLMFGMIGSTFMALLAVYGLRLGMDEALSARMLGWQGWGGAAMTFLLAWLASRFDRTLLLAVCTAAGALASLLLPWIPEMRSVGTPGIPWIDDIGGVLLISYLMIFGGVRAAHYGIAIMLVGDRFRGADLPSATTVFGLMFCSGSILGPALGGLAMDLWDPHGLAGAVFLFHLLLLPLPLVTWWRRRAVSNPRRG
ncbi:MAG: MFS transporter [Alphaproteobacteria bacterium]|nr:MFS transporter [Alphaproteobacteria bacterium]